MSSSPEICSRCHQPKEPKTSGRLTQWIVSCSCDLAPPDASDVPIISICGVCKKRIEKGRPGSFTQWVFRVDLCDCERPQPVEMPANAAGAAAPNTQIALDNLEDLEEDPEPLQLSPDRFPLERYRPLRELGGGAAGAVYLCRDLVLNKRVAVKTLRRLTPEQLVAFQSEARSASRLSHPAIVQVLDFGATASGEPFMVMEYINGISLDKYVEQHGTLPHTAASAVIRFLSDGLTVAHENGVFHRDLKPSNVLIGKTGANQFEVKLIDFGLSHMTATTRDRTQFQGRSLVGSPLYMSPDQAGDRPYDARCEIYSLGCILYELLTGGPPFQGETALNTLYMHVNAQPRRLSEVSGEAFPEKLEGIVARCLAKQPEDRYQSTRALSEALAPEAEPPAHTMVSTASRDNRVLKAFPFVLAIIAIGGLFAVVSSMVLHPNATEVDVKPKKPTKREKLEKLIEESTEEVTARAVSGFSEERDDIYFGKQESRLELEDRVRRRKEVENLVLDRPDLTDRDMATLVALNPMTISMNGCEKITDEGIKTLSKAERLDRLILDDVTKLSPAGIAFMKALPRLQFLSIRNSGLTDEHMKKMAELTDRLVKINVSGNQKITMAGLMHFKNRKLPTEIVAEGCACAALPRVAVEKLKEESNITLTVEDKDTFDLNMVSDVADSILIGD